MFREPLNFSYQRNWLQGVGWYLMFVIIGLVLALIVGRIVGIGATTFSEGFNRGRPAGQIMGLIYIILLVILLLWPRPKDAPNILLALAGITIYLFVGAFGGLIPLAVLTTRPSLQKP